MITCHSCNTQNNSGQKFCGQCGSALIQGCSKCGAVKVEGQKFCGQCGTPYEIVNSVSNSLNQTRKPMLNVGPVNQAPVNTPSIHALETRVKALTEKYQLFCTQVITEKIEMVSLDTNPGMDTNHPSNPWIQLLTRDRTGRTHDHSLVVFVGGVPSLDSFFVELQHAFSASSKKDPYLPALQVVDIEKSDGWTAISFLLPHHEVATHFAKIVAFIEAYFGIKDSDWTVIAE